MATEKDTAVIVRLDIPPSTHPATIKGKSPGANLGRATLTSIYDAYARVNDVASQVTDKGRLASAATPFIERAIKQAGRCIETLDQQIKSLDTLIAEKINTPVEPNLAGQIRSHFAARKSAMSEIGAAIEAGDTATASAVLRGPAYLSGLTEKNQAVLRMVAGKRFAPDEVTARDEAVAARERVETAGDHFMETMAVNLRAWSDTDHKILEKEFGS